jgi:phosphate transport system substrate-binding protein
MKICTLILWLTSLGMMCVAASASAQIAVTGGGVSMASELYKGAGDSVMPSNFTYLQSGTTGDGKAAFLINDTVPIGPAGEHVHFGASDALLTAAQLAQYEATYNVPSDPDRYGRLVQLPFAAAAIALPFNKDGAALNITDEQLCGIYSGQIMDWSALMGSGRAGPIEVVYRAEESGTTEILTRFLSTICTVQPGSTLKNGTFSVRTRLNEIFIADTVPAHFIHATLPNGTQAEFGDAALYAKVHQSPSNGRIGYTGPDVVTDLNDATKVAKLRDYLPSEVLPQATLDTIVPPSTTADVANPLKWVPVFSNPSQGYPLVGYTNLVIGQCYKNAQMTAMLRLFLNRHYSQGPVGTNDNAVRAHGMIPLNAAWREAIRTHLVQANSLNGLGNASWCGAGAATIGRPL